jgi:hypothetical protein
MLLVNQSSFEGGRFIYNHRMKQGSYTKNTFFVTHSNQFQIKNYLQNENVNTLNCTIGACYHYHPNLQHNLHQRKQD